MDLLQCAFCPAPSLARAGITIVPNAGGNIGAACASHLKERTLPPIRRQPRRMRLWQADRVLSRLGSGGHGSPATDAIARFARIDGICADIDDTARRQPGRLLVVIDYMEARSYIPSVSEVRYSRDALKTLRRMPRSTAELIRGKIVRHAANPAALTINVTALRGSDAIRLRVGDWRVIMRDSGEVISVIRIGARGEIYGP